MTTSPSGPCSKWADLLTATHPDDLSPSQQTALEAHLATCPACGAVRADYLRLDTYIQRLPTSRPLPAFPPQLLADGAGQRTRQSNPPRAPRLSASEYHPRLIPQPKGYTTMPQGRIRGVAALVSLAAIVALFVVVFHGFTSGHPTTNTASTPGASTIPGLTNQTALPVIAPSNPSVVYEAHLTSPLTLQRSDNDGATWQTLAAVPIDLGTSSPLEVDFFVSPLDAQHVIVEVQILCPTNQANLGDSPITAYSGSGAICGFDFFSANGGMRWSRVQWPVPGTVASRLGESWMVSPLQAQGNRLYARLEIASTSAQGTLGVGDIGGRLVTSTDGGTTWSLADQPLLSKGYCIDDYVPMPTGTTVFVVASHLCSDMPGSRISPRSGGANTQLWRSDDAGAHWTPVASYSGGTNLHIGLVGAGQLVLYDDGFIPPLNPPPAQATQVSVDGGKTWQAAPAGTAGQFSASGILGTLSDGSVVEAFADPKSHQKSQLFSWKPGDAAWHQLTNDFQGTAQSLLVTASGNGQDTLWLVTQVSKRYNAQRFDLK